MMMILMMMMMMKEGGWERREVWRVFLIPIKFFQKNHPTNAKNKVKGSKKKREAHFSFTSWRVYKRLKKTRLSIRIAFFFFPSSFFLLLFTVHFNI
jgi:hypothetical protein